MNLLNKNKPLWIIFSLVSLCVIIVSCCLDIDQNDIDNQNKSISRKSIYSWNREIFEEEANVICNELTMNDIGTIYQGLYPYDFSNPKLQEIVEEFKNNSIEIVYLVGDSTWKDSKTVIFWALEPLVKYNELVALESRIKKVCFDIEFFISESDISFDEFTAMMREIYAFCHENSLQVIICLPYWIPTVYGQSEFEKLLEYMDFFSCSVFLVGQEESLLQTVDESCRKNSIKYEAILELQPENEKYRVKEINTYYHKGLKEVLITSEILEQRYGCNVSMHNFSEFRKLLELQTK